MPPKLFISHASEDKEAFVRPLADKLKEKCDVWYDEFSLKVGDSLRASIDEGLRKADFGVVVLSPRFVAKQWTANELGGMFALENATRRMILPVWLDIGKDAVLQFSPILADRKAVQATAGLEHVVDSIMLAVDVNFRSQQLFELDAGKRALKQAMSVMAGYELNQKYLGGYVGATLVRNAYAHLLNLVWERLSIYNLDGKQRFVREHNHIFLAPTQLVLFIRTHNLYVNEALNCVIAAEVVTQQVFSIGNGVAIVREEIRPTMIDEKSVGLLMRDTTTAVSEDEVASRIVQMLSNVIEQRIREAQKPK